MSQKETTNPLDSFFNAAEESQEAQTEAEKTEESKEEKPVVKRRVGRPKKEGLVRGVSVQEGLTPDYTRATFILKKDLADWVKIYPRNHGLSVKDFANQIVQDYKDRVEKKEAREKQKKIDAIRKQAIADYIAEQQAKEEGKND